MAIFALSDLHLPLSVNKPMDVFGVRWDNYVEKIEYNWQRMIGEDDYVIINGDFSWATYLEDSIKDFNFLNSLPGHKIISKGNHDYWWGTISKMNDFLTENGIQNVRFLQNNACDCGGIAVCGARGWINPDDKNFKTDDAKIYRRELMRLEMSLKEAAKISDTIIAALHYPPDDAFIQIMVENNVHSCVFGHLHGRRALEYRNLYKNCHLVSADFLNFVPKRII